MEFREYIQASGVASVIVGGIALLAMVRVLYALAAEMGPLLGLLRFMGFLMLAVGALGACLLVAGFAGLFIWLVVMVIWVRVAMQYRAVQRRNLFEALTLAIERQMPLAPMAAAFAAEQEGAFARRVRQLAGALQQGFTLGDALQRARRILPSEAPLAAHIAQRMGDLPAAHSAVALASDFDRSTIQAAIGRFLYLSILVLYFILILTYVHIKIGPSYVAIFDDFQELLPAQFVVALSAIDTLAPLAVLVPIALVGLAGYTWLQWRGTCTPRLPGLRPIINWIDMGPVLRMLALATRRQQPLEGILTDIARYHPKRTVRKRMRRVVGALDDGVAWQQALRRRRLIGANDAALLSAAERSGNLSWALEEMASSFERRAAYRMQFLGQAVLPVAAVPIGVAVAFMAIAYFLPIANLITNLS